MIDDSENCVFLGYSNLRSLSPAICEVTRDSLFVRSLSRATARRIRFGIKVLGLMHCNMEFSLLQFSLKIVGTGFGWPATTLEDCYACSKFLISTPESADKAKFADFLACFCYYCSTRGINRGLLIRLWPRMN